MKRFYLISLFVALLDQIIKHVIRRLPAHQVFFRCPGLFELIRSTNTGAAFSILSGQTVLLALLSVLLLVFLYFVLCRMNLTRSATIAAFILIGGGLGNLIDRLVFGGVTDYIRILLFDFPIFNFADIAITLSVAVLIFLLLTNRLEHNDGEYHG